MTTLADKYPRIADMRKRALKRMPHFAAEYLFSGTGYDRAMDHNQEILKNIFLTEIEVPLLQTISLKDFSDPPSIFSS